MRRDDVFPAADDRPFQPSDQALHGEAGELRRILANRGEVHVSQPGEPVVVVTHDGQVAGHLHAGPQYGVQQPDGAPVVERDDGGRQPVRQQPGTP